jgi:hypothetical protein
LAVNAYDHYVIRGSLCVKLDGKVTEPKAKQANLIPMTDNHTSYLGYEQRRFKGPDGVQKESIVSIECNFSYPAKDIRIRWDEKDHSIKKQEGKWVGVFEIKVDTAVKKISVYVFSVFLLYPLLTHDDSC